MQEDNVSQNSIFPKEPIVFPKKKTPKILVVFRYLIIVIVIGLVGLYFYVHNFTRYFDPTGEVYLTEYKDIRMYISFPEANIMQIYVGDEYALLAGRCDYHYSGYVWNHLFGNWYFSSKSLLSLRNVDAGAEPATIFLGYDSGYVADGRTEEEGFDFRELENPFGSAEALEALFYSDSLLLSGILFNKVDKVDENIKFVADIFIEANVTD